jgi:hypothetical protein
MSIQRNNKNVFQQSEYSCLANYLGVTFLAPSFWLSLSIFKLKLSSTIQSLAKYVLSTTDVGQKDCTTK